MKLEKQVVSLELAKRLKELGVNQESLFHWEAEQANDSYGWNYILTQKQIAGGYYYSAFTVAELGEILGEDIPKIFQNVNRKWVLFNPYTGANLIHDTEADARAQMLIYLLENKLINQ